MNQSAFSPDLAVLVFFLDAVESFLLCLNVGHFLRITLALLFWLAVVLLRHLMEVGDLGFQIPQFLKCLFHVRCRGVDTSKTFVVETSHVSTYVEALVLQFVGDDFNPSQLLQRFDRLLNLLNTGREGTHP